MKPIVFLLFIFLLVSCHKENIIPEGALYFPANVGTWETTSITDAGFNSTQAQPLLDYLEAKHTKGFIILKDGKIVLEAYFNGHTAASNWYWASAGKTLTTTTALIAAEEGLIDLNNRVSQYLGLGWTSAPQPKENLITCRHLLTMTSGLNDALGDNVAPANLQYTADAGTRWAYHNVYVKLQNIVAAASGQSWANYFNTRLRDKIGMDGLFIPSGDFSVYYSTTRSMARFGWLALNQGNWNGQQIVTASHFNQATTTSQNLNLAYGYLWWLNGKANYRLPQSQLVFPGTLIPNAPNDMYAALGKNDQKIYVIPSKKIVIVRMGEAADGENFALSQFDNDLWAKISLVINN